MSKFPYGLQEACSEEFGPVPEYNRILPVPVIDLENKKEIKSLDLAKIIHIHLSIILKRCMDRTLEGYMHHRIKIA